MWSQLDKLFKEFNLDLHLTPYGVLATSEDEGLMEFVHPSMPLSKVVKKYKTIQRFFGKQVKRRVAAAEAAGAAKASPAAEQALFAQILDRFCKSCAGYCVITYILGIGDRHQDNIMIKPTGELFHIDFGYIFGCDPKPWPSPMRITTQMVDGMGGRDGDGFRRFMSACCQAYKVLRTNATLILTLLRLMGDAGIESMRDNPTAVCAEVQQKLRLDLTDDGRAEAHLAEIVRVSADAKMPAVMDFFHDFAMSGK